MDILAEKIDGELAPLVRSGITFYPAAELARIFDWASREGRTIEWVEGVFYDLAACVGQLSLDFMCERGRADDPAFRTTCLRLADEIQADGVARGLAAYFEIGIST